MNNPTVSLLLSIGALILLLAGVYYLNKKLGTATLGTRKSKYMKTLDRLPLARDRWIEMIQLGDEVMLIGVTPQSFQLLKTIPSQSLEQIGGGNPEDAPFRSVLEKFMNNKKVK